MKKVTIAGSRYTAFRHEYDKTERPSCAALDKLIGLRIKVLDQGYLCVRDYMGDWRNIADTARMSYNSQTGKKKSEKDDKNLISRLLRDRHTSPFEANAIRFEVRAPIHVIRQWFRHRTGSPNEESARYSIIEDVMYVPALSVISPQSLQNKQGREAGGFNYEQKKKIADILLKANEQSYKTYDELLKLGLTRELARSVLNTNTYSRFSFKIDLHNLLKLLSLRAEGHAQYEIRQYANVMESIVAVWVPPVYEAYLDYVKYGVSLGRKQANGIVECMGMEGMAKVFAKTSSKSEYLANMNRLILVTGDDKSVTPEMLNNWYILYSFNPVSSNKG